MLHPGIHRLLEDGGTMPGCPYSLELISMVLVDRSFVVACTMVPWWTGNRGMLIEWPLLE